MDKYVCGRCLDDEFIQDFIAENAVTTKCSYCGKESKEPVAANVSDVARFMEERLMSEYDDAANCLPYESREGGYQGITYTTYDLLTDEIELAIENDELLRDLISLLPDILWCDQHPFQLPQDRELIFDWDRFSEEVKHRVRHVFFRINNRSEAPQTYEDAEEPYEVLYRIGELVIKLGLCREISPGKRFFRARLHRSERFSSVADLGPPRKQHTRYCNRFSPAGIPMFYGACDAETAIAEVYDCPNRPKRIVSVGIFENMRAFRVLDFTNLVPYPSIFNEQSQQERAPLKFIHHFVRDITKGITKDGREHVDYVPTQVVTEFFRHILRDSDGKHIEGMLYPSARLQGGTCCVIFCSNDECTEDFKTLQGWFGKKDAVLSLDTEAILYRELP